MIYNEKTEFIYNNESINSSEGHDLCRLKQMCKDLQDAMFYANQDTPGTFSSFEIDTNDANLSFFNENKEILNGMVDIKYDFKKTMYADGNPFSENSIMEFAKQNFKETLIILGELDISTYKGKNTNKSLIDIASNEKTDYFGFKLYFDSGKGMTEDQIKVFNENVFDTKFYTEDEWWTNFRFQTGKVPFLAIIINFGDDKWLTADPDKKLDGSYSENNKLDVGDLLTLGAIIGSSYKAAKKGAAVGGASGAVVVPVVGAIPGAMIGFSIAGSISFIGGMIVYLAEDQWEWRDFQEPWITPDEYMKQLEGGTANEERKDLDNRGWKFHIGISSDDYFNLIEFK